MGRLGSEIWVSASFQIIARPVRRLGSASEPHVVGRLRSGLQVGAGGGIFDRGLSSGELSPGGGRLSPRIVIMRSRCATKIAIFDQYLGHVKLCISYAKEAAVLVDNMRLLTHRNLDTPYAPY